jgi:acetolactate synthase-1/2/3 large subunit
MAKWTVEIDDPNRIPELVARAFGAEAALVERTADFAGAFDRALGASSPFLIEIRLDPNAINPSQDVAAIRAAAYGQRSAT